jgi:outer membrane immunogenic protein
LKKYLIVAAAVAASGFASAAPGLNTSWTGFYIGANGGYGWNNTDATVTPGDPNTAVVNLGLVNVPPASTSFDTKGWFGGVQAGYNWQFNDKWVAGIETDFDGANIKGSGAAATTIAFGATPATFNASQKVEWFGTLRARLGYLATNNLLIFATGGLAYGKVVESADVTLPPGVSNSTGNFGFAYACGGIYGGPTCFAGSDSRISAGWTVGGGAEYAFAHSVTFKLEYLYVNLGSSSFGIPAAIVTGGLTPSSLNAGFGDAAFNVVRAGLNYRF